MDVNEPKIDSSPSDEKLKDLMNDLVRELGSQFRAKSFRYKREDVLEPTGQRDINGYAQYRVVNRKHTIYAKDGFFSRRRLVAFVDENDFMKGKISLTSYMEEFEPTMADYISTTAPDNFEQNFEVHRMYWKDESEDMDADRNTR